MSLEVAPAYPGHVPQALPKSCLRRCPALLATRLTRDPLGRTDRGALEEEEEEEGEEEEEEEGSRVRTHICCWEPVGN